MTEPPDTSTQSLEARRAKRRCFPALFTPSRPNPFRRIRQATADYPRQFWLLFWGRLISAAGGSMVWPFLTIYLRQRLEVPLTTVTLLLTANSIAGLVTTTIAGPVVDRFGRKGAMLLSLGVRSAVLLAMSVADTLDLWIVLMIVNGAFSPLFDVGSNAMVADMIEPERRGGAYALLRMISNAGVAIGPSVGGFVTEVSYALALWIGAATSAVFGLLVMRFVRETVPQAEAAADQPKTGAGYGRVLRDWPFLAFCGAFSLTSGCAMLMFILLPVYTKENFGLPESRYGFIMSTNAAMVVLFQYLVTRVTERFPALPVLAVGSLFYAVGVGSVAWGWGFWTFWASMVVITIGELMVMPTATALTANLAPPDMRGRYMGVYNLTWGIGFGTAPVIGGWLNDNVGPVAIWYGGLTMGLTATLGFLLLARMLRGRRSSQQ